MCYKSATVTGHYIIIIHKLKHNFLLARFKKKKAWTVCKYKQSPLKLHCVLDQHLILPPRFPAKACTNPYFIEKWRCLSSVSLFLCRKALGLLTSSPLPSFLLSEGTHLKNENKVIVPVLFLKSLQMLSVDERLIVRRAAAVQAAPGGKRRQVQVEERQQQQAAFRPQHRRKHTLCSTQRVSPARRPQCCRCTRLHGTDWHTRRGFTFNGLFGMHGVVKYRLGSVHRAPKKGDVKRMKGQDPANYWKQAKRKNFNSLKGMLQHFGGRSVGALLGFCL